MSLPKDLHPVAKDVPIPSECLFGDYINARVINIKTQQKAFKVNQTQLKPERAFDRHAYFPKQDLKNWGDFKKAPEINARDTKTRTRNRNQKRRQ